MCKDWHVSTNGEVGFGMMVHVWEGIERLLNNDMGIIGMSITGGGFFQFGNGPMTISCCSRGPALATASKSFPFFGNGVTNNDSSSLVVLCPSRVSKRDLFRGKLVGMDVDVDVNVVESLAKFGGDTTTMGGGGMSYLFAMFGDPDTMTIL